jgi:hypothetical protein
VLGRLPAIPASKVRIEQMRPITDIQRALARGIAFAERLPRIALAAVQRIGARGALEDPLTHGALVPPNSAIISPAAI